MMKLRLHCLLSAALLLAASAPAEVSLPRLFSSHMVLQRDMPIHLWGHAAPAEQVAVDLGGVSANATADSLGRWSVYLPPRPAGGPFTLSIRGQNTLSLDDILLGDLWLASGQSNMEMPLVGFGASQITDSGKEIAAARYPRIRLLHVEKDSSSFPLDDLKATTGWSLCTPVTAAHFSAVAYFFGRDLQRDSDVPIGLIDSTWGGTPAEAWTSLSALTADASLMPVFAARAQAMDREADERLQALADRDTLAHGGTPAPHPWHPGPASWEPAALFNAMIAPLTPLPLRGVIWYQGESNSSLLRAPLYARLFPALIQDWRDHWQQGNFPFLFVQISAFASSSNEHWGVIRDAQRRTLALANTGMAVTLDVGDEHDVHPANKQAVGARLALLARHATNGDLIPSSGPLFRLAYPSGGAMRVWFEHAAGLTSTTPVLQGFEVAGPDLIFTPANASIENNIVVARSATVPDPRYVRYAWANFPQATLTNAAHLPASTFTSTDIP